MKRLLAWLMLTTLPATAAAQTRPPALVQMQNGQPRAVTPVSQVDTSGNVIGGPDAPLTVNNQCRVVTTDSTSTAGTYAPFDCTRNNKQKVANATQNLATAQVSVGTTAVQVAAARELRQKVTVSVGAANTCAFGNTVVTTTTGFALQPVAGATLTLDSSAALFAVCSATTTINVLEQF